MESRIKVLGHPLHPMLIVLPLGLLSMAVIFDILQLLTRNNTLSIAAYWNIAAGVVTGLLAAAAGLRDWIAIPGGTRAKTIGALHGLGNLIVVVLFAAIQTTHDERRREAAILRTLGASTRQIGRAQTAEFMVIGALSGVFAAVGATSLGFVLASRVLEVPYEVNPLVWVAGLGLGALGVALAGLLGTRGVLRTAPMEVLRRS